MPAPFAERIGAADDVFEREADRVADVVVRGGLPRTDPTGWAAASLSGAALQRASDDPAQIRLAPKEGASALGTAEAAAPAPAVSPGRAAATASVAPDASQAESPASEPAPQLLVEDDTEPTRGQMRKRQFMATLRAEVCAAVDDGLSGTGRDSQSCPWVEHWLGYYEGRSSAQIERSLRRYAPEAAAATAADDYIRFVTTRVRRSAEIWATSGAITGMPDDMPGNPMPGGGVLASFGGMFFKARPGGPRSADPVSVREQLGGGQSMPGRVRARMESAFGANFAGVRLHTDTNAARISDRLNARAFTVGEHVAFGGGQYRPGTIAGDALIAHELAHVVQQGQRTAAGGPFYKGDQASTALEQDADGAAASAVVSLWSRPDGRRSGLGRAMPRLRSGLHLQRCSSSKKAAESPHAKAKLSLREERAAAVQTAGEHLRKVDTWASAQVKGQNVPGLKAVTNLDAEQAGNVADAIQLLTKAESQFGTKEIDALPGKLDAIVASAREARKFSGSSDELHVMQGRHALGEATNAATEAGELVAKLSQSFDVSKVAEHVDQIANILNDIQSGKQDMLDGVDAVAKHVKQAKELLRELRARFEKTPKAIGRVLFVLKSFLALNAPKRATPPTADEIKQYKGTLRGSLSDDFSTVFAEGKVTHGFDVFVAYADVLEQQLDVREKMAKAGVEAASPVPTQGNAESYFKTLKSKSNAEVFAAYTTYAQAYFFHRVVDKFNDMDVQGVSDLYERPLSIFGLRPLVCTGYALLGSHLLTFAGARLKTFIVAVRATDEDVVSNRIDAGHALAAMNRAGKDFFVSNHLIVNTKNDGIGPDAVAWEKSKAPLHEASGTTIPGANAALRDRLADLGSAIEKRRSKPKK